MIGEPNSAGKDQLTPELDEFEQEEREAQRQVEKEANSGEHVEETEEDGHEFVPDSVQNRQFSLHELKGQSVEDSASTDSDYPDGYPARSQDPPPAYSPIMADSGGSGMRDTLAGLVKAGGMAAAVATSAANEADKHRSSPANSSSTSLNYQDDIRDQHLSNVGPNLSVDVEHAPQYRLSNEVKELFHLIDAYTADRITIRSKLQPFLLDYLPAVGDVDPFLKVPRPDGVDEHLGLVELDEPAVEQSDWTIVNMKLRNLDNTFSNDGDVPVKKLDRADKNVEQIDNWIKSIKELRRHKVPDRVSYDRQMPDLESLMQEWPPEVDSLLKNLAVGAMAIECMFQLPTADMDCTTNEFVDICMALLDIPVHKSRIQALHVFFSLYLEFRNSQHFKQIGPTGLDGKNPTDRLEL